MNIVVPDYPEHAALTPRPMSGVTLLIIHHSVGSPSQSPLAIDQEHRNEGWVMVGYHYMINGAGVIYEGRPIDMIPSAAYGANENSIDICLLGDFQSNDPGFTGHPTIAQWNALCQLSTLMHLRVPTIDRTIGHRDVAAMYPNNPGDYSTACPGDTLYAMLPQLKEYVSVHSHP